MQYCLFFRTLVWKSRREPLNTNLKVNVLYREIVRSCSGNAIEMKSENTWIFEYFLTYLHLFIRVRYTGQTELSQVFWKCGSTWSHDLEEKTQETSGIPLWSVTPFYEFQNTFFWLKPPTHGVFTEKSDT